MTVTEYKQKVIELFESGRADLVQWDEMAEAVLKVSKSHYYIVDSIDTTIFGPLEKCRVCEKENRPLDGKCWNCGASTK